MSNSTYSEPCECFPYVFEGKPWDYAAVAFTLVAIMNCSLLAVAGNMFIAYLVISTRRLWTKKHVLVVNMICVDLLTAIVSVPSYATFLLSFVLHEPSRAARNVHLIASNISFSMTVVNLSLISYERYFAVMFPYQYHAYCTTSRLMLVTIASWLYGLFFAAPVVGSIAIPWDGWVTVSRATKAIFLAHVLSSLVCHGRICRVASSHQRSISPASMDARKLSKGAKSFLYIVVAFLVCSLPSCAISFVRHPPVEADYFAYACSYTSCGLNWLIYTLRSEDIKVVIKDKMRLRRTKATTKLELTNKAKYFDVVCDV